MKWRTLIFSLITLSFIASFFSSAFAEEKEAFGLTSYGAITLESLKSAGLLKLNGTSVAALQVKGSLIAKDATIGSLEIFGEANLSNSTVEKTSSIFGTLQATHAKFLQPLTLQTRKATFTASKLDSIRVQPTESKGKQILELRQGTEVNGSIVFESGNGEVHISRNSHLFGSVTGGKVLKK